VDGVVAAHRGRARPAEAPVVTRGVRVLILNERDPAHPKAGGAEVHVAEIFGRLAARGFEITQVTSGFAGGAARDTQCGMRVVRVGALPAYYPRAAAVCARESRRGRVDVVVECLNKLPFLSPVYARAPVVALCHHLFGETAFQQVAWPVAASVWAVERLIPRVYRRAHFVAISESTRGDLIRRGVAADRIEVHHPGITPPPLAPPGLSERGQRIAYVGRLERYKNVDVLIDAFAAVAVRFPAAHLLVIGQGADRARLERRAAAAGVAARTTFTGFVPEAEKQRLLASARVCVCPSAKEGWGLTVIESNALGTPNVASDAPGLRDSVRHGETGFLARTGDAAAFAAAIAELLADDALAGRMSAAAVAWSRGFAWDRAAEQMAGAIRRAAAERPA
jgi:glycosyltransferase involved in cell wall biosynthesis